MPLDLGRRHRPGSRHRRRRAAPRALRAAPPPVTHTPARGAQRRRSPSHAQHDRTSHGTLQAPGRASSSFSRRSQLAQLAVAQMRDRVLGAAARRQPRLARGVQIHVLGRGSPPASATHRRSSRRRSTARWRGPRRRPRPAEARPRRRSRRMGARAESDRNQQAGDDGNACLDDARPEQRRERAPMERPPAPSHRADASFGAARRPPRPPRCTRADR